MGGTSAGAALMSKVMITGDERLNKDTIDAFVFIRRTMSSPSKDRLLTNVIIDQHFVTRKRHNRLISVVLEHPELIAVGIDEATAIIVHPRGVFDVIGRGNVVVYDATQAKGIRSDPRGNLAAGGIIMHLLVAGDSFRYDDSLGRHRRKDTMKRRFTFNTLVMVYSVVVLVALATWVVPEENTGGK